MMMKETIIDSIEKNACGTSKDLLSEKEDINCNNIVKKIQRWLTLMMLKKKSKKNIIQNSLKFLVIPTVYL